MKTNKRTVEVENKKLFKEDIEKMFYESEHYLKEHPNLTIISNTTASRKRIVTARVDIPKPDLQPKLTKTTYKWFTNSKVAKNYLMVEDNRLETFYSQENKEDHLVVPDIYTAKLNVQQKALSKQKVMTEEVSRIKSAVSTKIKRNEEDLLMANTDKVWLKNQIINVQANERPVDERYGLNGWYVSLRRPRNFEGKRNAFVNLGSENIPKWARIDERVMTKKERMNRPMSVTKREYEFVKRNKVLKEQVDKMKIEVKEDEDLKINVKGNDLREIEKGQIEKGRTYRLYLDNFNSSESLKTMTFKKQYDKEYIVKK